VQNAPHDFFILPERTSTDSLSVDTHTVRVEWRGGLYEDFATLNDARKTVLILFPRAKPLRWKTTDDGNHRCLAFVEYPGQTEPVARILIPLTGADDK
jgi:hypothetical protein